MFKVFKGLLAVLLVASGLGVHAIWVMVDQDVPVDRILKNVQCYITEHPKDAKGYYTLGRVHSLAFATDKEVVRLVPVGARGNQGPLPKFGDYSTILIMRKETSVPTDQHIEHLRRSLENYFRAAQLDQEFALAKLGLAWMLEQGAPYAEKAGALSWRKSKPDRTLYEDEAIKFYRRAFDYAYPIERTGGGSIVGANNQISKEAAEGILRIYGTRKLTSRQKSEKEELERAIAVLARVPRPVTPIIFPLDRKSSLGALLAGARTSGFDLAADGKNTRWNWPNAGTGILVWDPRRTGKITSGSQLFGSSTWWMFFGNGYEALASLDDDQNGVLESKELMGIRVWLDQNMNGQSDRGEVVELSTLGICGIGVRAERGALWNPAGITYVDGTSGPSYDWIATEIR